MKLYLLDTNVLFYVIETIANHLPNDIIQPLLEGKCYISELSRIEIISVLGKHARGSSRQIQICDRIINENGDICGRKFYTMPKKPWNKRVIADWRKLIKDITEGSSPAFNVDILPVTQEVCNVAKTFIVHALKHNFGSLDAMIAATAIDYKNRTDDEMTIVTYDKKLLAAVRADDTIPYLKLQPPGK